MERARLSAAEGLSPRHFRRWRRAGVYVGRKAADQGRCQVMIIQTAPADESRLAFMMHEHTALAHQLARSFGNDRFPGCYPNEVRQLSGCSCSFPNLPCSGQCTPGHSCCNFSDKRL
jgi:hypothetical protein